MSTASTMSTARKRLAAVLATAALAGGLLATAPAAQAADNVKRVDKYKTVSCDGFKAKIWYRDYDNNRTMLRTIHLTDGAAPDYQAEAFWRADGGRTTIQEFGMLSRGRTWVFDQETKDTAIAKNRHPYVKFMFKDVFLGKCTAYVDLN